MVIVSVFILFTSCKSETLVEPLAIRNGEFYRNVTRFTKSL